MKTRNHKPNISAVIDVCDVRQLSHRACKDCVYYGDDCNYVKHKLAVEKPYQYIDLKESKRYFENGN